MQDRIVITGMGAITPLGLNVEESWNNVIDGVSGVAPITNIDTSDLEIKIGCEVKNFQPGDYLAARQVRRRDRVQQLTAAAAQEAIRQSGLDEADINPERIGVIVSSAVGGMKSIQENLYTMIESGTRRVNPFVVPMFMINGAAGLVAIDHGYLGPCFSVVSACATGADTLGTAWMLLQSGVIDVVVTGSSEAPITNIAIAGFNRLRAMSGRNDDYSNTPQPFDLNRDGLVMGEGSGIMIMEKEGHARSRGVNILAEFAGYASTVDAFHITSPSESGEGGARAIRNALAASGLNRSEVQYINAHGTATVMNDYAETLAIKSAFGDLAYNIPISSTKSMTGHMMGGTGSIEAIFCVQVVRNNVIPPTINYQTPDPECDLDYVPNQNRELPVDIAISNSFGFGGHNAVIAIKEYR